MRLLAGIALLAWFAIYLPDAGRGFIKDDWAWLLAAPLAPSPWDAAWTASTGFFRPLVSLSFTANHALFGLNPIGYGLTNLLLALACAAAIYWLARAWRLRPLGSAIAAFIWLFTPHGMDMGVIWISGRSALLLVLFATAACASFARGQRAVALALMAAALLSKDEAVVMPALLAISALAAGRFDRRRDSAAIAGSLLLVAGYLWMRAASGAHMPWNAPADYRPVLDVAHLAANAAQYADRLLTFPAVLAALAFIVTMRRGAPLNLFVHAAMPGLAWAAIAMLPTIALPVRSSLYSLLPLAGAAVAAAQLIDARLMTADRKMQLRAAIAATALLALLIPLHRSRQHEWSDAARLSSNIVSEVRTTLRDAPQGTAVYVRDRLEHPNLETTFGNLLPEMLKVTTGKDFELVAAPDRGPSILFAQVPR